MVFLSRARGRTNSLPLFHVADETCSHVSTRKDPHQCMRRERELQPCSSLLIVDDEKSASLFTDGQDQTRLTLFHWRVKQK